MPIETQMQMIQSQLGLAAEHLAILQAEMERLEQEGMYPAIPVEQWQARNGSGKYLYMLFRKNGGTYQGPGGKRKVYVGCDPERVAEARRLRDNRLEYEDLAVAARRLEDWLADRQRELESLAARCQCWDCGRGEGRGDRAPTLRDRPPEVWWPVWPVFECLDRGRL